MEYPHLVRLYQRYRDRGLVVVSVSRDSSPDVAARLPELAGATFPVIHDRTGAIFRDYNVTNLPHNVAIDRDGKIIASLVGYESSALDQLVRLLVER